MNHEAVMAILFLLYLLTLPLMIIALINSLRKSARYRKGWCFITVCLGASVPAWLCQSAPQACTFFSSNLLGFLILLGFVGVVSFFILFFLSISRYVFFLFRKYYSA